MISLFFKVLQLQLIYCSCDFYDVFNIEQSNNFNNYSVDINIEEYMISGINFGFGLWIRYLPLTKFYDQRKVIFEWQRDFFSEENELIQRKEEKFIFSMHSESNQDSQLILSHIFNDKNKLFDHKFYLNFQNTIEEFSFEFDSQHYEGEWFIFYINFNFNQKLTTLGFFQILNNQLRSKIIQDLPKFDNYLTFRIGGLFKKLKFTKQIYSFQNFFGTLSGIFSISDPLLIEQGFRDCLWFEKMIDMCRKYQYPIPMNSHYLGEFYTSTQIPETRLKIFILNGWVKLYNLQQPQKESVIFRIILDPDYQDDENLGDRFLYLKYFQNQDSELNGFELTTQSYTYPIIHKYQTQPSDIISSFGSQYSEIFVKWHNIQFETGNQENNGQPLFTIFSPELGQFKFHWNKIINYFTQSYLYFYLGGDKYSQTFLQGWLEQFQYLSGCVGKQYEIYFQCDSSCSTCNGPTSYSCTSCNNMRDYDQLQQTCDCQANFYENLEMYECVKLEEIYITAVGSIQEQIGIDQCEFGYFLTQNGCIQCPYFVNFISKTQIICADCYLNSFQFATDLKCTYDYYSYNGDQDTAYELYQRSNEEIEIFQFDVLGINLIRSHSNFTIQYCDDNYFYLNRSCHTIQNCIQIQIVNRNSLECQQCELGYYLENNNCKQCGNNCGSCNSNDVCFSCKDPQKYYLTFEGHSCKKCEIQYCIYCFSYYYQNDQIYSTLDLNFKILDYEQIQIFEGCALCQENYFFNFQNQKCEYKCSNFQDQFNEYICLSYQFKDCMFGVTTLSNENLCIKSQNQLTSIQNHLCQQYQNCKECIKSSCVVCNNGYYIDLFSGQCMQCPTECLLCSQQNHQYQDYWKQSIRGFYNFLFNQDSEKSFLQNVISKNEKQLEIICFKCNQGYVLYNNKCIKDCDSFCSECKIINGVSQCIKCPKTTNGFLRTKSTDGICLECPDNCAACFERSEEEIKKYNPYFILTDQNKKYTHGCFELLNYQPEFNLNLDQKNLFPVRCDSNNKCYNQMKFEIVIACSPNDNSRFYPKLVYLPDEIFNIKYFWGFEILTQSSLKKLSVQEIFLEFMVFKGSAQSCQIHQGSYFSTKFTKNVFSLNQINLEFYGPDEETIFEIEKSFELFNFTTVVFRNIIFKFSENEQNLDNQFKIIFSTLDENLTISFQDCVFMSSSFNTIELSIIVNKPYNLIFQNVQFQNLNIKDSILFTQDFNQHQQSTITIQNFTIESSYFLNSTLFQLMYENETFAQVLKFEEVQMITSEFNKFTFLSISSNYQLRKTQLEIQTMKIYESTFISSLVFLLNTLLVFNIQYFEIISSQFQGIIFFHISNFNLNLNHVYIQDIINYQSSFINNQYQISKQFEQQREIIRIEFNNISLSDIGTDNNQQFWILQNYDNHKNFTVLFNQIVLSNIYSVSKDLNISLLQDQKCFIDFECEFCLIKNLKVARSYGVIEFKLQKSKLVELSQIEVSQFNLNQKILHASIDCASTNLLPYITFMILQQSQEIIMQNLFFTDCIIFNQPLIKIIGYDVKQIFINEKITLQDSNFYNIKGIINNINSGVSIIYFSSNQQCQIMLNNLTFENNILHSYVEKQKIVSSSTLLFQTNKATIQFYNSIFIKNLATNTSNSILYINSFQLNLYNLSFSNNNLINNQVILDSLLYQQISYSGLNNLFPIKSLGGNGYLLQNTLIMKNISILSSSSDKGGCFYIEQNGEGRILIENSVFSETFTSFSNSSSSQGGCFYFDTSNSIFNLKISASIFNQTFSYKKGGAIFIEPSKTYNKVQLLDIQIENTFSLENSFLSYKSFFMQNVTSEIIMDNIKFNQNRKGFEAFFSQFSSFGLNYKPSPMIFIKFGNVSLQNVLFLDAYLQYFVEIEDGCLVKFQDVIMFNNTFLNSQLITIHLNKNLSGQIIFTRVSTRKIQQFALSQTLQYDSLCETTNNNLNYQDFEIGCQLDFNQNYQTILVDYNIQKLEVENLNCNKKINFKEIQNITSLISFQITNKLQKLFIIESTIESFYCQTCIDGIIKITIKQNDFIQSIFLKDIQFLNNFCGLYGCINISPQDFNDLNVRLLSENISYNDYVTLIIQQSRFIKNEAVYGGSLFLNSISGIVSESQFFNNKAKKGGAIYYTSHIMQLQLVNTQISSNQAEIAGGIYMKNLVFEKIQKYGVQIINNNSTNFANDLSENPSSLTISIDGSKELLHKVIISNSSQELIEQINITNNFYRNINKQYYIQYPSGIKIKDYQYFNEKEQKFIPLNLSLRIVALNQFLQQEKQLEDAFCTLNQKVMNIHTKQETTDSKISSLSQTNISFNNTSGDFNLDNLKIYFNPLYTTDYYLRIIIQCNMIVVPISDFNYKIQNYTTNYQLYFDIQTYPCQIGEYLNNQTGECVICDAKQNLYSLINYATNCTYRDSNLIDEFTSATIQLRPGYWRAQNNSTKIEQCSHFLTNCLGGWVPGDESCYEGHVGALCEQCDLYNIKNKGSFSRSNKYQCGNCDQIVGNIIKLIIISLWIVLSIMLSVDSTIQNIKQIILNQQFYILGLYLQTSNYSAAVLIKFLTNYLQIISNLESFEIQIPQFISALFTGLGNPITQMSSSYDCFLASILSIEINYFRIIWIFFQVLFSILTFALIQFINHLLFKKQLKLSSIYTALLFIYVYINLSLIENLIQQLSYRNISDIRWVQGNVSIQFDSEKHQKWIYELIIPVFIIFGLLLPFFLFTQIYKQKNLLNNSKSLTIWGYLTIEYKNDSYYWELVKIIQRQILVLIINYYEDYTIVKASLVVIVLYSYSLIQTIQNPYKNNRLNQLEGNIMKICSISMILGSCIFLAQNNQNIAIIWAFELALIILNSFLFFYLIMLIIKAYIQQFHSIGEKLYSILYNLFPIFLIKHQSIRNFFIAKNNKQQKIYILKAKIRKLIMPYVKQSLIQKKKLFQSQCLAKGFSFSLKKQAQGIPILKIEQNSETSQEL